MSIVFSHVVRYDGARQALKHSVESAILESCKVRSFFTPTVNGTNNDSHSGSDSRRCFECAYTLCVQGDYKGALAWYRLGAAGFTGGDEYHAIHANGRASEHGLHIQCNPEDPDVWYIYFQAIAVTPWGNTEERLELGNIPCDPINHRDLHDEMQDIRYNEGGWFDLIREAKEEKEAVRKMWADLYNEKGE